MFENKYVRYFTVEAHFKRLILVILGLMIMVVVQSIYINHQRQRNNKLQKKSNLVLRIKDMEKALAPIEFVRAISLPDKLRKRNKKNVDYILRGTGVQNGIYHAVINNDIYKIGDTLGEYTITKIGVDEILLENKPAHKKKFLRLPN